GGRRYYRPDDVNLLRGIRHLLYGEGYTIRGVQRILREQGGKFVAVVWQEGAPQPPHGASEDEDLAEEAVAAEAETAEEDRGLRSRRFAPGPFRAAGWRATTYANCTPCCTSLPNAASSSKPRWRAPNRPPPVLLLSP